MTGAAFFLVDTDTDWHNFDNMRMPYVYWLRSVGRCEEVIEAAQRVIQTDPNGVRVMTGIYHELAVCKTWTGHAEEAIALQKQ